jgi:hypothetical protein
MLRDNSAIGKTGFKFEDIDFADDAAIDTSKLGTRTLKIPLPLVDFYLTGTSAVFAVDGVHITALFPNANSANAYISFPLPANYVSGQFTIDVYWKSAGVTGNAKIQTLVALKADGDTTASEGTFTVTDAVPTTADQIKKSTITVSGLVYTAGDLVGLNILRDPSDVADTLASDIELVAVVVNYTGRG